MRRRLKLAGLAVLLCAIALTLFVMTRSPSVSREWDEDVSVLAGVEMSAEGVVQFTAVRDWQYTADSIVSKRYFDETYDPADIVDVWMYEQKLSSSGLIAHTFLVFEFDDRYGSARFLGLSVETRRESGEEYSLLGGVLRSFEVTHIWATESDLVTRRVQFLDYPLTRYRLEIPAEYRVRIFEKFARETGDLATTPRWYNTVANNCTSSLIRYVNESEPGAIPLHYSYVLTGKVDDYLKELGYVDPEYAVDITVEYLEENGLR
jgi:hypothetical protein